MGVWKFGLLRFAPVAALALGALTLAPVTAYAGSTTGHALVPSEWGCTGALNGDVEFLLPAVAISPGQGALIAPFPGFLATDGSTYVVLAAGTSGSVVPVGKKTGLATSESTCTLVGTDVQVVISPAG